VNSFKCNVISFWGLPDIWCQRWRWWTEYKSWSWQ